MSNPTTSRDRDSSAAQFHPADVDAAGDRPMRSQSASVKFDSRRCGRSTLHSAATKRSDIPSETNKAPLPA
ncbi:hypothetical protein GCM10023317_53140 [Actinopolymorpha pittospori]|uniref:Uncharacterized protein n=1 Tax=Actinopolymorpha pittospori TaxID=648752 RepID=A0A927MQ01_9ACTN|nr:hypothetical protein [Actinopolymorpha pittospori]